MHEAIRGCVWQKGWMAWCGMRFCFGILVAAPVSASGAALLAGSGSGSGSLGR